MPLQIDVEPEHEAVTALKKKVADVADKYTRRHGWCNEVRAALTEAGIYTFNNILVEVTFTVAGSDEQKATTQFPIHELAGKTEEEMKKVVAEKVSPKVMVMGSQVTIPIQIVDLNKADTSQSAPNGVQIPEGYMYFYTSNEGRVMHLTHTPRAVLEGQLTAEQHIQQNYNRMYSLCGDRAWSASTVSSRSENRVCQKCSRRAGTES